LCPLLRPFLQQCCPLHFCKLLSIVFHIFLRPPLPAPCVLSHRGAHQQAKYRYRNVSPGFLTQRPRRCTLAWGMHALRVEHLRALHALLIARRTAADSTACLDLFHDVRGWVTVSRGSALGGWQLGDGGFLAWASFLLGVPFSRVGLFALSPLCVGDLRGGSTPCAHRTAALEHFSSMCGPHVDVGMGARLHAPLRAHCGTPFATSPAPRVVSRSNVGSHTPYLPLTWLMHLGLICFVGLVACACGWVGVRTGSCP
jgi:hypothetical protein